MGRPRDIFAWEQVTPLGGNRWKCKHCKDKFSGAASRIRDHLSGQGNGIATCPDATEPVRNEAALKKINQNKRVRLQDPSPASSSNDSNKRVHLQDASIVSSSNIDAETIARRAVDEHVAAAFLKFLYCNNVPSVANDLVKDPHYMEFVQRASELGFPSSSVWGDSRFMKRTVSRIEYEVNEYIDRVKESWKTTGCTRMLFNLRLLPTREEVTAAFYCPKGIFFEQGKVGKDSFLHVSGLFHCQGIDLQDFVDYNNKLDCPSLAVSARIFEQVNLVDEQICELTDIRSIEMQTPGTERPLCIRNHIQQGCSLMFHRSGWAGNLLSIAEEIHKILCSSLEIQSWYYNMLRKYSSIRLLATNRTSPTTPFEKFIAIRSLSHVLATGRHLQCSSEIKLPWETKMRGIIDVSDFWNEGEKLGLILDCVMKIGDVMDTFVPTAGYLGMALDEVDRNIQRHFAQGVGKVEHALQFWKHLRTDIEFSYYDNNDRLNVGYLNPVYYLQQLQKDSKAQEQLKAGLNKKYDEEVDRYADEFRKVPADYKLEQHHPVKVWEEYGDSLPNLQRIAIKALSQPLSCMCKQVKKHLYQLEGAEDYIFRLNFRMMQHFKILGDDIFKPLDLPTPLRLNGGMMQHFKLLGGDIYNHLDLSPLRLTYHRSARKRQDKLVDGAILPTFPDSVASLVTQTHMELSI